METMEDIVFKPAPKRRKVPHKPSLLREWYMRLFQGYWKMTALDVAYLKVNFLFSNRTPDYIPVRGYFLVSPPRLKEPGEL